MTRVRIVLAALPAIAAGPLALAVLAAVPQLTERPLSGALAHPAIGYYTQPTHDLVNALNHRIEDGSARLTFDEGTGYLRSVLEALHVPVESQILVMSKTGIQGLYTEPANPRAIYFNDAVTVGYIRGAPLLELAVQDPEKGVVFYTIEQKSQARPVIDRRQGCLTCHQTLNTLHVPGLLARSIAIAADGSAQGSYSRDDPDDRTPFQQRWGGWYVSGTSGSMSHRGRPADGAFDSRNYASPHSDIAALMVFQHQVRMTNLITRTGWEARMTGAPPRDAVNELVDALLFVDEEPLTDAIAGTTNFAATFAAQGPADSRGRSLHQLDLEHRLLRYPCSYMIYSASFGALPADVRAAIYARMSDVLAGRDASPKYARLVDADRRAVVEILRDTLPDFPARLASPLLFP